MSKYIDAELLRKEIEKNKNMINGLFTEGDDSVYDGEDDAYNRVLRIIDSLQQEPIEKDEETEKLIVCDIIEATIARINGGKKDEEKEEKIMREKIAYLRDLGLKNNDN